MLLMAGIPPLLENVLEGLSDGVAVFSSEAKLEISNAAFGEMNPEITDFLSPGTPWNIVLREAENRGAFSKEICKSLEIIEADLLDTQGAVHRVKARSSSGKSFVIRMNSGPDGGFVLTQSLAADEDTRTDAARQVEILLSKVLEACPACLTMSRVGDGQIIYRSPAATGLLGSARSSFSHFAKREERADFITALLPDAHVDDMQVTGVRPDGTHFPARISARLIEYRGEEVIVSNMEDMTGMVAVQAELARKRIQVFQAEKLSALGELLAGVAHELNNPLSVIVGNTEMLREDLEGTEHERRIRKLGTAADRCVRIVRSFLSMARQEPLDVHRTEIREILRVAREAVAPLLAETGIRLEINLPSSLPDLMVDEVQISQVVTNLLTNSAHAIQESGPGGLITVSGEAGSMASGMVCLTVSDNGPGVAEDIRGRIFDPLFTTKDVGRGTGVGLAFCHRVISAHGGTIRYVSGHSPGATFELNLPAAM